MIPHFEVPPLELGPIVLHAYGVLWLVGWLAGLGTAVSRAERQELRLWIPIGLFVLAPLPALTSGQLWSWLLYGDRAPTVIGFVLVVVPLAVVWLAWADPERLWTHLDGATLGLVVTWTLGRVGSFLVHDEVGGVTGFPLAVRGICDEYRSTLVACHDLGLYELLASLAWLGALAWLRERGAGAGIATGSTAVAYGAWRFVVDFLRDDPRTILLTPMQWFAPLLVAIGVIAILAAGVAREERRGPTREGPG